MCRVTHFGEIGAQQQMIAGTSAALAPDQPARERGRFWRRWPATFALPPRSASVLVLVVVGAVAAGIRLRMLCTPTPFFYGTYDDGVYFATALNFLHGHLPYRDGVFLQPPGMVLATSPFALLASIIGDAHAFVVARGAFALIGGINAVLVAALLRRMGLVAAAAGGLIYALSWPAIYTERTISLEILGTTGVLVSLLFLRRSDSRLRWPLLAGVAAGVAVDFKVWYVAIFLMLALTAWRRVLPFLLGGAVAGLAAYLPFFVTAPVAMWRNVVTAQLGRPNQGLPLLTRIRSILGLDVSATDRPWWQIDGTVGVVVLVVLLALMVGLALAMPTNRIFVALLAVSAAILLLSPSYLQHYATLTAGPLALVGGAGAGRIAVLLRGRWAAFPVLVLVALMSAGAYLAQDLGVRSTVDTPAGKVLPTAALHAAAAKIDGCLVSDDPTVLILMNRLSRDLDRGCRVQADPSGAGFVLSTPGVPQVYRPENPKFQREIVSYLHSADAYVLVRGRVGLGLSRATLQLLKNDRVLATVNHLAIRAGGR